MNAHKYSIDNDNRVLHIANVTVDESNSYSCEAKNEYGESTMLFDLGVLQPPTYIVGVNKGALTGSDREKTKLGAKFGESVEMKCPIGGKPQPDIYWTRNVDESRANDNQMDIISKGPIMVR